MEGSEMLVIAWIVLAVAAISATAIVLQVLRDVPNEFPLFDADDVAHSR